MITQKKKTLKKTTYVFVSLLAILLCSEAYAMDNDNENKTHAMRAHPAAIWPDLSSLSEEDAYDQIPENEGISRAEFHSLWVRHQEMLQDRIDIENMATVLNNKIYPVVNKFNEGKQRKSIFRQFTDGIVDVVRGLFS
jgi:hypothetical protein